MVFALDVGTRKIAGLLASIDENERIIIHDIVIKEHEHRAMLDGQIHDVDKVAKTVRKVKEELEKRNNIKLDKVAVALAGRFLNTQIGKYTENVTQFSEINSELITRIELAAVDNAVEKLQKENMYCVGYSVIRYELDDTWLKSLQGLRGSKASVEVVTAFLPVQVVDAMVSVLRKVNLTMTHMTLEPIAAINVTVPEDLRILNIAMIDVGAGTSDIAISREGTIIAYGMVPLAGDEITEAITKALLVDFSTAEEIKRWLADGKEAYTYRNILDKEKQIHRKELINIISPVLENITKNIADEILKLNGEKPQVVMVIGGGAKVPGFIENLAKYLEIDSEKISLKDAKNLNIEDKTEIIQGSEFVTPIGIAYTALTKSGAIFEQVYVNDTPIQLIGFTGSHTIGDVLLQCGYTMADIMGRPGNSLILEVNGKMLVKKGQMPVPAPIFVNGRKANIRDKVRHGDKIEIGRPKHGDAIKVRLYDIVPPIYLKIKDRIKNFYPPVMLNGMVTRENVALKDGDKIEYDPVYIKSIRKELEKELASVEFFYNDVYMEKKVGEVRIFRNDLELKDENKAEPGETLKVVISETPITIKDITKGEIKKVNIILNGERTTIEKDSLLYNVNGVIVSKEYQIKNGDKIYSTVSEESGIIVADILQLFDIDLRKVKTYRLLKNGKNAYFTELLEDGDEITFTYELK
ncbi:cell division protein FtsA [Thermosipho ferrireducens]|uniref:Cell division protein FtsA n=1 Tax=Thermosipho ferrireducens TaxID=2571116 RepID=A0ABX7S9C3_9BACT|nr:cell division protein FtsA [Thermosipho ferrireducens]